MSITLLQGRLGNQLFEYAYARALSFSTGTSCVLSEAPLLSRNLFNRLDCFTLAPDVKFVKTHKLSLSQRVTLSAYSRLIASKSRMERYAFEKMYRNLLLFGGIFACENGYIKPPCKEVDDSLLNIGYFQSERYFLNYKNEILRELHFKESVKRSVKSWADKIDSAIEPTCLHVRLGDYVKNPLHGVADAAYYKRAIDELRRQKPNATIFLFSDNIELVKAELGIGDDINYIPSEVDDQQTMYLGSLCHNFIISNSSFSWWMQYLSQRDDRLVIAPSRWYAMPCPCDVYQDSWQLLDV